MASLTEINSQFRDLTQISTGKKSVGWLADNYSNHARCMIEKSYVF
jgi:hypothetical protein